MVGSFGYYFSGFLCWGRVRRLVWVFREFCFILNGGGEGCLLVVYGFVFFRLLI